VEKSQEEIQKLLPPQPSYKVDTSEFQDVKARLGKIENRRKLDDSRDKNPELRRASQPSDSDDDHPVLKRDDGSKN
jgi:hypothetical protein